MKTYLTFQNQIQGFSDVSATVKTVEKIAASSIHLLKTQLSSLNQYASQLELTLNRLTQFYFSGGHPLLHSSQPGQPALVILTGDRGLVGGLWHQTINTYLNTKTTYKSVMVVGAKGDSYLREEQIPLSQTFTFDTDFDPHQLVSAIDASLFAQFRSGAFSRVDILYPRFISIAQQQPAIIPFLPFTFQNSPTGQPATGLPIFDPSRYRIFSELLQKYIGVFFYRLLIETRLSELTARTVAMEHATVKTDQLISHLILDYAKESRRLTTQRQLTSFAVHKLL
jgi:F-type H+-transporting ATPase subunit gamma